MATKRCTSSREGKVLLSCWITPELRMELDRVWAAKGYRPHGRTQHTLTDDDRVGLVWAFLDIISG